MKYFYTALFSLLLTHFITAQNLSSSLTACYALDGNGAEPINNLTGTLSAVTATVDRFGNSNSALSFSGVAGSNVALPNSNLLKANAVTVTGWVRPNINSGTVVYVHNGCGSYFEGYELGIGNNHFVAVKSTNNCSFAGQIVLYGNVSISTSTWYHVAMYAGSDSLKLYVNGVLDASLANSNPLNYNSTADVYLGGTNISPDYPFSGSLDNFRFYNRKLSGTEINQIYIQDPSCLQVPTSSFTASSFSICSGSAITFTNLSTNTPTANNWQVTGPATASSSGTNPTFILQTPGIYTVALTSSNSFGSGNTATHTVVVSANPGIVAFSTASSVCLGQSVTLIATGANTYSWSSGQQGAFVSLAPAASSVYTVNGTSTAGCLGTATVGMVVNSVPVLTVAVSQPTLCQGNSATLTASGANSYSWSSQQSGSITIVSPTGTTVYTVTGISGDCSSTKTISLLVYPSPVVTITPLQPQVCQGSSLAITATGATSYSWSSGQSTFSIGISPPVSLVYTVTGTSSNCNNTATVMVTVNPIPVVSINPNQSQICQGSVATLTAYGAVTYSWSSGQTSNGISVSPTGTSIYTVTGTSNNCSNTATASVIVSPVPTVSATTNLSQICQGASAVLMAYGANLYLWNTGQTGANISVNPSGNSIYTVTGTSNNCSSAATVAVNVSLLLNVTAIANPPQICQGGSAVLTASGAVNYLWSNGQTSSSISIAPGASGIYTVTGTYSTCSNSKTVAITVIALPPVTAAASASQICQGGSVTLNASGAVSYSWNTNQTGNSITISPSGSTVYTVTGTANTCTNSATVSITVHSLPPVSAAASSNTVCSGSQVILLASGASSYAWSTNQTAPGINVIPASTTLYSVTGTDNNNCSNTAFVLVVVNPLPVVSVTTGTNLVCAGSPVSLQAHGATTYTWSTQQTGSPVTVNPVSNTTYSVSGTNTTSCIGSSVITISVNALPLVSITAATTSICSGNSVTLQASGAATYSWSTQQTSANITVYPIGTTVYAVVGTNSNSCSNTATISMQVNPSPVITASASSSTVCRGATVTLSASGGNNYIWSNQQTGSSIQVIPTVSTIYGVSGNNLYCNGNTTVSVNVNPLPVVFATVDRNTICVGESAVVKATGATSYSWSNSVIGSSMSVMPLYTTTYSVTGSDNNGCINTAAATVSVDLCLGIKQTAESSRINLFPNPNNGSFTVELPDLNTGELQIVNALSQVVYKVHFENENHFDINLKDQANGLYYLKVITVKETFSGKLIKQ